MKFMIMTKADADYEAGKPPSPELMAAIGQLTEKMRKSGAVLQSGGLLPSSKGSRVRVAGGKMSVTDGPFTETKELIGGFAILQAGSMEEVVELTKAFLQVHADVLGPSYQGECEIRPMFESGDCAGHSEAAGR